MARCILSGCKNELSCICTEHRKEVGYSDVQGCRWQTLTLALLVGVEGSDVLLFEVEETWGDNHPLVNTASSKSQATTQQSGTVGGRVEA